MTKRKEEVPQDVNDGIRLLNQDQFYEAHEAFETAWRRTQDPSREFYRALLQVSGGFFRLSQGKPQAAKEFFAHALKWLALFPSPLLGFNTGILIDDIQKINNEIENGYLDIQELKEMLHLLYKSEMSTQ
jgi:predicted metal-dependent hydrolase